MADGYQAEVSYGADGGEYVTLDSGSKTLSITNTHEPVRFSLAGEVVWLDAGRGPEIRPE